MSDGTRSKDHASAGSGAMPNAGPKSRGPASAFETIAGDMHLGADRVRAGAPATDTLPGGKKQKICCACGKDVAHEERFKDRAGHYWCMDCGVQEHRTKHALQHPPESASCPDCSQPFAPAQLVEFDNLRLCPDCVGKRQHAAEREATRQTARKAAVAQAVIDADRRRRRILLASAVAAVLAVAWAIYILAF